MPTPSESAKGYTNKEFLEKGMMSYAAGDRETVFFGPGSEGDTVIVQSDGTVAFEAPTAVPQTLDDLTDVDVSSAATNDVLTFNGVTWDAQAPVGGAGAESLTLTYVSQAYPIDFDNFLLSAVEGATPDWAGVALGPPPVITLQPGLYLFGWDYQITFADVVDTVNVVFNFDINGSGATNEDFHIGATVADGINSGPFRGTIYKTFVLGSETPVSLKTSRAVITGTTPTLNIIPAGDSSGRVRFIKLA